MKNRKMIVVAALAMAVPLISAASATIIQAKAGETSIGTVLFARDSDKIDPRAAAELDRIAKLHASDKGKLVVVRGHSDSAEGDEMYGYGLSQRRSNEVRSYLVVRGVPAGFILTEAFSLKRPLAKGASPKNRRVEVLFSTNSGW